MRRTLVRIGHEIVEGNANRDVAIVGIHRRGATLAVRLHRLVARQASTDGDIHYICTDAVEHALASWRKLAADHE